MIFITFMLSVYHIDISSNILRIIKDDSSSLPCPQFSLSKTLTVLIGIPLSFARHEIFPKMTVKINKLLLRASASDCQRAISQIRGTVFGLVPYSIEYMHIQDLLCSPAIWPRAGRGGPRRRYRGIAGDGLPDIRPVTPLRPRCHPPGGCRRICFLSPSLCLPLVRNFLPLAGVRNSP